MPLWNKRAVSSGQTEESYKEQLQSLKQTVNFGIKKPSKKEGLILCVSRNYFRFAFRTSAILLRLQVLRWRILLRQQYLLKK